jgi:predicted nucleic acid-binding protein
LTKLVDTNVLIEFLRGYPKAGDWMLRHVRRPLAISSVSVLELFSGARDQAEEKAIQNLLSVFQTISVDARIGERAGKLKRRYAPSHSVGAMDAIIAATALAERLTLVTLNVKHFPMLDRVERPY